MKTYKIDIEKFNEGCELGKFGELHEMDNDYDYVEFNIHDDDSVDVWGIKSNSAEMWHDNATVNENYLKDWAFETEGMTREDVLENLEKLVGSEFDADEVICAFEDFEEDDETEVIVKESENSGYNYIAYIATEDATQFLFKTEDGIIVEVEMFR